MAGRAVDLKSAYDVVVVGGRCAGAAAAMLLARQGLDVLLVEQAPRGTDTTSTLALMRGAVMQLSRWGLLDGVRAAGTPKIQKTTFHYGGDPVEIAIAPRDGVDALYAPRRTVLDPLLADAAAAAGADVAYGFRFRDVLTDRRGRVSGAVVEDDTRAVRRVAAGLVVGADGLGSPVARRVGAEAYRVGAFAGAVIYGFVPGLDVEGYHWHYAPGVSAGAIPTGGGEVLVFASLPRERFLQLRGDPSAAYFHVLENAAPRLAAALRIAPPRLPLRTFAGHVGQFRRASGPGWALVGDAGYFKDPLTAHGMTDALRDATLLARAVEKGTDAALAEYQAVRDALSDRLFEITDEIASFSWDMARAQQLHRELSEAMAQEVRYLRDVEKREMASV